MEEELREQLESHEGAGREPAESGTVAEIQPLESADIADVRRQRPGEVGISEAEGPERGRRKLAELGRNGARETVPREEEILQRSHHLADLPGDGTAEVVVRENQLGDIPFFNRF